MFSASKTSGPSGYNISNSLRFRASASAYLSRTQTTNTNSIKCTFSAWVKRGNLTNVNNILSGYTGTDADTYLYFSTTNKLVFYSRITNVNGAAAEWYGESAAVFRDPSAWYHVVVKVDTSSAQATNNDYYTVYVNNVAQTFTTVAGASLVSAATVQNRNTCWNVSGYSNNIAAHRASNPFDGYMAEVNFIDGQALTPSSFGSTNATTGVWQPRAYTGTYGTNGFYLKFSDIATTSGSNAGLGKDFSGNTNYWTTNNISVTSGTTYDAMTDSPTLTSATVANYATLNPLDTISTSTPTFANLRTTYSSSIASKKSTIVMTSGKWYTEWNITGSGGGGGNLIIQTVGIISPTATSNAPTSSGVGYYSYGDGTNSQKFVSGTATTYGTYWGNAGTYTLGAALDITGGTITFYLNGVSQGAITLPSNTDGWVFVNSSGTNTGTCTVDNNFGQRPFSYTPPTGYSRLNTYNIPTSTIVKGNTVMDATLYTGNGTSQTITNAAGFRPDLVWIKGRSYADFHTWFDTVRGATLSLSSNLTTAEVTRTTALTAFTSTGFTVSSDTLVNFNANTLVAWQWQAGQGTNTTNTAGSITSTISVSTTAGFSIVTYTGTGVAGNKTIGHGLGVAPSMIILKDRDTASSGGPGALGANDWFVWHSSFANVNSILGLNSTVATQTTAGFWGASVPSSTVFGINGTLASLNESGDRYLAYCWAEIAGFSKFGSYTGNGSTDGPFVYLGFRPKYILIKVTSAVEDWMIYDSARGPYNANSIFLRADTSDVGGSDVPVDFLSNGFKLRSTALATNSSGNTYIYAAFAENPFKNALAR